MSVCGKSVCWDTGRGSNVAHIGVLFDCCLGVFDIFKTLLVFESLLSLQCPD